jgi:hypothetical protein
MEFLPPFKHYLCPFVIKGGSLSKDFRFKYLRDVILKTTTVAVRRKVFHETVETFTVSSVNEKKRKRREMLGNTLRGSGKKDRKTPLSESALVGIPVV